MGQKVEWKKHRLDRRAKMLNVKNINKSTKGIREKPLIFCFLLLKRRKTFPKQVLILPIYRDYILLNHFQSRFFLPFDIMVFLTIDIISIRHFLSLDIMSHSAFLTFDIISRQYFFAFDFMSYLAFLPSFFCPFVVLSHVTFCPFDIFYHSTFFPSNFCPIRRFVR
jgi:hypothetical protein